MSKAAATRSLILQKAFELIYVHGYQGTSIDDIIATTQVTKGAFFYHFKNKDDMGLAVIKEVMYTNMYEVLVRPLLHADDPVKDIYKMMKELLLINPFLRVTYGCPANNLIQEMSPLNDAFNLELEKLVTEFRDAIEACIHAGKKAGKVRKNVHARQVAYFVMAGYGGIRNLGKVFNDTECYVVYLKELKHYLKGLE